MHHGWLNGQVEFPLSLSLSHGMASSLHSVLAGSFVMISCHLEYWRPCPSGSISEEMMVTIADLCVVEFEMLGMIIGRSSTTFKANNT